MRRVRRRCQILHPCSCQDVAAANGERALLLQQRHIVSFSLPLALAPLFSLSPSKYRFEVFSKIRCWKMEEKDDLLGATRGEG
jgi:hypothetical protein